MRRGANGHDAIETINAAATVIASGDTRGAHASAQKRRWGGFWSLYWCFGSPKNKRIGHAILVPERSSSGANTSTAEYSSQPSSIILPFVAPPSSPASFLPSEPPSATQSPTGIFSMTSVSANMYSPGGPASMFAIGPYAHETQLVSPPVFSTFTTEPSTAPYTPPPESVHMTTPSSPEVPFARLLEPHLQNGEAGQRYPLSQYEFQSYQLQPGSPVSHLISPCSGISGSGTSSPFPDREFATGHPFFLEFKTGIPPKLLELDRIVLHEWGSCQGSGAVTPDTVGPRLRDSCCQLSRQDSDVAPLSDIGSRSQNEANHRVSFEITDEEVIRCMEKNPGALVEAAPEPVARVVAEDSSEERPLLKENRVESSNSRSMKDGEMEGRHQKNRTITLGSSKDFNFENVEGGGMPASSSSEWWVKEKADEEAGGQSENWSFFPMMQTGVS